MKSFSFLAFVVALVAQLRESSAFFLTTSAVARPSLASLPFVGKRRNRTPTNDVVADNPQKSSLDEFNSACQQAIEEERRMHYYPYLADTAAVERN